MTCRIAARTTGEIPVVLSNVRIVVTESSCYRPGNIAASPQSFFDGRCLIPILSPPEIMRKHSDTIIFQSLLLEQCPVSETSLPSHLDSRQSSVE